MLDINSLIVDLGRKARKASRSLATASSQQKRDALIFAAENIKESIPTILEKNQMDLDLGSSKGLSKALMDRLLLNEARISSMIAGLEAIANQNDPIGEVMRHGSGLTDLKLNEFVLLWVLLE